jgi:hypothetical protein
MRVSQQDTQAKYHPGGYLQCDTPDGDRGSGHNQGHIAKCEQIYTSCQGGQQFFVMMHMKHSVI